LQEKNKNKHHTKGEAHRRREHRWLDGELGLQQAFGVEKVVWRGQVLGLEATAMNSVQTISGWRQRRWRASLQAAGEICAGGVRLDLVGGAAKDPRGFGKKGSGRRS
jgi:hypothetical protein